MPHGLSPRARTDAARYGHEVPTRVRDRSPTVASAATSGSRALLRPVGLQAPSSSRPTRDRAQSRFGRAVGRRQSRRRSSRSSPRRATGRRPCWPSGPNARRSTGGLDLRRRHDNDPAVLLTYIAVALHRIERIDPRCSDRSPRQVPASRVLGDSSPPWPRCAQPVSLVLDHLEAVTNPESLDAVAALALRLPAGSQMAIGSRNALPLPAARLRAQGGIVEIGVEDLAMNRRRRRLAADCGGSRSRRSGRGRASSAGPRAGRSACTSPPWRCKRAAPPPRSERRSPATTGSWATTCVPSSSTVSRGPRCCS